jgi:hypothetical protein
MVGREAYCYSSSCSCCSRWSSWNWGWRGSATIKDDTVVLAVSLEVEGRTQPGEGE